MFTKFETFWVADDCAPGCNAQWIGDDVCDEVCYNEACSWDGGDCLSFIPEAYDYASGYDYNDIGNICSHGNFALMGS